MNLEIASHHHLCGPSYANDYAWFNSVCQATANLGIGLTAYYWATINGLAPLNEGLLSSASSYTPNHEGTDFINAYIAPTPTPRDPNTDTCTHPNTTAPPTPTPTPVATPEPTPTPAPIVAPSTVETATVTTTTISASTGIGGSISPSGNVNVNNGDNETFTITPDAGYYIADVTVNGTSVGAVNSYTLNNIQDAYV